MSFNFYQKEGLIVVPTRIWGPSGDSVVQLALDTGATKSMVNWDLALLLGYDPSIVKERIQITTGSGVEFVPTIVIEKIEALENIQFNMPFLCHTLPPSATVDGLLGLDFFRSKRLVLDFCSGQVIIE